MKARFSNLEIFHLFLLRILPNTGHHDESSSSLPLPMEASSVKSLNNHPISVLYCLVICERSMCNAVIICVWRTVIKKFKNSGPGRITTVKMTRDFDHSDVLDRKNVAWGLGMETVAIIKKRKKGIFLKNIFIFKKRFARIIVCIHIKIFFRHSKPPAAAVVYELHSNFQFLTFLLMYFFEVSFWRVFF